MPVCQTRIRSVGARPCPRSPRKQRISPATGHLDTPPRLIAPVHSLAMPTLDGVRTKVQVSYGFQNALPLAQALAEKGLLVPAHFDGCQNTVEVLARAMEAVIRPASPSGARDMFSIEIRLSDRLDDGPGRRDCLFFTWGNTDVPQYIPLRPMFEYLDGNPYRERLMASLYHWLHGASLEVCNGFGFREAKELYNWDKQMYADARESGEDVDSEGEAESANPSTVVGYIRRAAGLKLKRHEIASAISSISRQDLRDAFEKAHHAFLLSRKIRLPDTSRDSQGIIDDAAYYMDGEPIPGLCVSHWRDDAIVAWLDNYCDRQFNSGVSSRAPIIRCFPPNDSKAFLQIVSTLPIMVQTALALSEWVRFGEEMENEYNNGDRGQT